MLLLFNCFMVQSMESDALVQSSASTIEEKQTVREFCNDLIDLSLTVCQKALDDAQNNTALPKVNEILITSMELDKMVLYDLVHVQYRNCREIQRELCDFCSEVEKLIFKCRDNVNMPEEQDINDYIEINNRIKERMNSLDDAMDSVDTEFSNSQRILKRINILKSYTESENTK